MNEEANKLQEPKKITVEATVQALLEKVKLGLAAPYIKWENALYSLLIGAEGSPPAESEATEAEITSVIYI